MVTAEHAYELPPDDGDLSDVAEQAEAGEVTYLTHAGRRVAAVVPLEVAAAGAAAIEAIEDALDLREVAAARAEGGSTVPHEEVMARYAGDLEAFPADDDE